MDDARRSLQAGPLAISAGARVKVRRSIQVGEAAIECLVQGDGQAVVLLPGMGGDVSQFDVLAPALDDAGFCAVAINPRGVGGSKGPLGQLTLHDFADDVAGVIGALNIAPAHLLGRAFGNRVARCVAADHPAMVRSVTLLAAGGFVAPDPEALTALQRGLRQELPGGERLAALKKALFSPASTPSIDAMWAVCPAAAEIQLQADRDTPLAAWWSGGTAPLLVVQGLDDRLAPPANGRALRDQFGERVRLVEIPNAGHALIFEQPKIVTEAIISFLREHS